MDVALPRLLWRPFWWQTATNIQALLKVRKRRKIWYIKMQKYLSNVSYTALAVMFSLIPDPLTVHSMLLCPGQIKVSCFTISDCVKRRRFRKVIVRSKPR